MAITYQGDVLNMHVPTVFESDVHPLDVNKEDPAKLCVDSYFAGTGGRSTAGYVVFMNGEPVIWSLKLMKVAATSSSEAEIIEGSYAKSQPEVVRIVVWFYFTLYWS